MHYGFFKYYVTEKYILFKHVPQVQTIETKYPSLISTQFSYSTFRCL